MSHSSGTSIGTGKRPVWQTSAKEVGGTAKVYPRELRFGHKASRKRIFHRRERGDTLQEPSAMNHGHPQGQELQKRQKYCTWT